MGLMLHRRGVLSSAAAAWTPAELFTSGEAGAYYDISDLSTLWKDTAGTDPVTADGDAVARVDDLSGNGNHWLQATASKRPAYKTDGTFHWLLGDGADDQVEALDVFGGAGATVFTIASAYNTPLAASTRRNIGLGSQEVDGSSAAEHFNPGDDSSLRFDGAATAGGSVTITTDSDVVRVSDRNGSAVRDWIDGASNLDTTASISTTIDDFYGIELVQSYSFKIYAALAIDRLLTSTERHDDLEPWLADRNSVTL